MDRDAITDAIDKGGPGDRMFFLGYLQRAMMENGEYVPIADNHWKKLCKRCQQKLRKDGTEEGEDGVPVSVALPREEWLDVSAQLKETANSEMRRIAALIESQAQP